MGNYQYLCIQTFISHKYGDTVCVFPTAVVVDDVEYVCITDSGHLMTHEFFQSHFVKLKFSKEGLIKKFIEE